MLISIYAFFFLTVEREILITPKVTEHCLAVVAAKHPLNSDPNAFIQTIPKTRERMLLTLVTPTTLFHSTL